MRHATLLSYSLMTGLLLASAGAQAQVGQPAPSPAQPSAATRVSAPAGPLIGSQERGLSVWEGIPYAQPPVGERRWRAPQPMPAWTEERPALQGGAACPQFLQIPGQGNGVVRGQEDCLTLNVYAPQGAEQLPVMVWIHGGSFNTGASTDYDPRALAREQNVVVVSMNYRLGALGFLATPGLEEGGSAGNYGLLDQQLALHWVRSNIAAFGGNAQNVTVFGESAGGMSICQHLLMPQSRGLFDKAIIQSGPCTAPNITAPKAAAFAIGSGAAEALGCKANDAACLRRLPLDRVVRAQPPSQNVPAGVPFPPVYGVSTLPDAPAAAFQPGLRPPPSAAGNAAPVPLLIGSNLDEARLFAAWIGDPSRDLSTVQYVGAAVALNRGQALAALSNYPASRYPTRTLALAAASTDSTFACPTNDMARSRAAQVPVYAYEFRDRGVPTSAYLRPTAGVPAFGAFHAAEIASVMGGPAPLVDHDRWTAAQRDLGRVMRTYWANFARSGNPNGAGLPQWPQVGTAGLNVMEFRPERVGTVQDFRNLHKCDTVWSR